MEEFSRYFESYVWSSYWSEYFWPLAEIVGIALFLVLCFVYLATYDSEQKKQWTKKQVIWCSITLLLGMSILFQDIFNAYRHISKLPNYELIDYKDIYGKSEKIDKYPDKLYSEKGQLLGDEILLKGYFEFDFPTTSLGGNIQMLVNKKYRYGGYFPVVVTGKKEGEYTIRVAPPYDYKHFSEEIVVSEEEAEEYGWYSYGPYDQIQELWWLQYKEE